jgi:hypothetical protein
VKANNVTLNPLKSILCSTSVTWCGRRIDSQGVQFDDSLVQGLIDLERPLNAQQLQQFIGACHWIRSTILNFSEAIAPLQNLFLKYLQEAKSMKGTLLRKYKVSWDEVSIQCVDNIKRLLANQVNYLTLILLKSCVFLPMLVIFSMV